MSPIAAATTPMTREKLPALVVRVVNSGLPELLLVVRHGGFRADLWELISATLERKYWPWPVPLEGPR